MQIIVVTYEIPDQFNSSIVLGYFSSLNTIYEYISTSFPYEELRKNQDEVFFTFKTIDLDTQIEHSRFTRKLNISKVST